MTGTYLVTGATGKQGAATIHHLQHHGCKIHALVRDASKTIPGATLFQGDFENMEAIREAAVGCTGIFLNLPPTPRSVILCESILQECKTAGITTVVVSTAMLTASDKWKNIPALQDYYEVNLGIEMAVKRSGLQFTILRPAWLFSNYLLPASKYVFSGLAEGTLVHAMEPSARMPQVSETDIGLFAASALLDPRFNDQEIELVGANLTIAEVAEQLSAATGRIVVTERSEQASRAALMFQLWANAVDISVDSKAVEQKYGLPFQTLEAYLRDNKDNIMQ